MHVLTKIFVVLVSLLAVFLVPLVVVYAYNEDSYRARYQAAAIQAKTESDRLATAQASLGAREATLMSQIDSLRSAHTRAMQERDQALVELRQLESRLASAQSGQEEIRSELRTLAQGNMAHAQTGALQLEELKGLRRDHMIAERKMVELDEAYREVMSQLEVAVAARRALQEELQRMSEQHARTAQRLSEYVARFGTLTEERDAVALGTIPDRDLVTTVTHIRRTANEVYIEIGAGSREGVREGWTMTVGRGKDFLAKVRIISVDITRSVGIVILEDPNRGLVDVGDSVRSWAGVD